MNTTSRAFGLASRWFDEATVERVFAPLVADWQREWLEAPPSRRRWIGAKGFVAFATTFLLLIPSALLLTPIPQATLLTVLYRMARFLTVACTLLSLPFLISLATSPTRRLILATFVLPSIFAFAFSFAPAFIVDSVRTGAPPTLSQRRVMAQLCAAAAVFVFFFGGWVAPKFHELVRIETTSHKLHDGSRDVNELNTLELLLDPTSATAYEPYTGGRDRGTRVNAELHNRAYAVVLPILLVWLRWQALALPRAGWLPLPASVSSAIAGVAVTLLALGMWRLGIALELRSGMSNWLSATALLAWGLAMPYRRQFAGHAVGTASRLYRTFQDSRIP